jgi:hypothetical protein
MAELEKRATNSTNAVFECVRRRPSVDKAPSGDLKRNQTLKGPAFKSDDDKIGKYPSAKEKIILSARSFICRQMIQKGDNCNLLKYRETTPCFDLKYRDTHDVSSKEQEINSEARID